MDQRFRRAIHPGTAEIASLRMTSNARVAAELLGSGRSTALDIGCGEGKFTRALTRQFGMVAGIDVKERAILAARKAAA